MLTLTDTGPRLCDRLTRREWLRAGGLTALGLSLPELLRGRAVARSGPRTRSCIVLFLMGGPPQHSTWDPKPAAPPEIRGEFGPTATAVPGIQYCSLLPQLARQADRLCALRAVSTRDNAHSSSGYYMLTGMPHAPTNVENANPGAPNNWPTLAALVRRVRGDRGGLPGAVRLPMHIFNTDGSVWPGQDAGFLGRDSDPWLVRCEPGSPQFQIPELNLVADVSSARLDDRQSLLNGLERSFAAVDRGGALAKYDRATAKAFDLLRSPQARAAFALDREPEAVRARYGRHQFGQSCLLARRLVEAGVGLVQVNWFRSPDEPSDAPCWDTHVREGQRLKTVLAPTLDQSMSALIDDLQQRGLLDETLVVCMSEFGRTPRISGTGRGHWGSVFSVALAGGGVRGGAVFGASDKEGGQPKDGRVRPEDVTATILHCLGHQPNTEFHDAQGRPLPLSRGDIIRQIF
ncbi:MAG: DUF1501 domain-containing protein [Gemmataceae bacterium]